MFRDWVLFLNSPLLILSRRSSTLPDEAERGTDGERERESRFAPPWRGMDGERERESRFAPPRLSPLRPSSFLLCSL